MIHFDDIPSPWRDMMDKTAWLYVDGGNVVDPTTDWDGEWALVDVETDWRHARRLAVYLLMDSELRRDSLLSRMPSEHDERWMAAADVALEVAREVLFVIVRRIREMSHDEWEEWFMEFLKRS